MMCGNGDANPFSWYKKEFFYTGDDEFVYRRLWAVYLPTVIRANSELPRSGNVPLSPVKSSLCQNFIINIELAINLKKMVNGEARCLPYFPLLFEFVDEASTSQ